MTEQEQSDGSENDGVNIVLLLALLVPALLIWLLIWVIRRRTGCEGSGNMQQFITDRLPEIEGLCRTHKVQSMSIFGSAVRSDFNPESSDVDVRVIFDSEKIERYARNAFSFQDALAALFARKVDMLSGKTIRNPYLREAIERDQVVRYAA